jgi:hypothetical protein
MPIFDVSWVYTPRARLDEKDVTTEVSYGNPNELVRLYFKGKRESVEVKEGSYVVSIGSP